MNKTKIEWADYTWNVVTGCLHGCDYCYARRIANRFSMEYAPLVGEFEGKFYDGSYNGKSIPNDGIMYDLYKPVIENERIQPYPAGFMPTFHRYRLNEPQKIKKPSKIFICSMADLFGDWVPDEWIEEVFKACQRAPEHKYMFLTKNPQRYCILEAHGKLPDNFWYGTTITDEISGHKITGEPYRTNRFLSIEPLLGPIKSSIIMDYNWIIIGAQTGPGAVKPKPEWVQSIIDQARAAEVPIFLKNNLHWSEKIQEFPEGL